MIERNRYEQKTVTYKRSFNGAVTQYDKYGRKIGSFK